MCIGKNFPLYNTKIKLNPLLYSGDETALECDLPKHCGPVRSMDFNPAQKCLLASGASASEIHIVDINKPSVLMTPGPKAQVASTICALYVMAIYNLNA